MLKMKEKALELYSYLYFLTDLLSTIFFRRLHRLLKIKEIEEQIYDVQNKDGPDHHAIRLMH